MKLYIVGRVPDLSLRFKWIFVGVFTSRERALDACVDEHYFVGDAISDVDYGPDPKFWPHATYPRAQEWGQR